MSLGGLTALCLAANHPELVERLVLVDITPGTDAAKAEPILAFLSGPERFPSFEAMLARTVAFNATRSESSLRRGVIHNSRQFPDGSWGWRWDPSARWVAPPAVSPAPAPSPSGAVSPARAVSPAPTVSGGGRFGSLWPAVDAVRAPILLLRGARSSVVSDHDVSELRRRQPAAEVEIVPDAGHSIQGDQPIELARRLNRFLEL
jgi:pimeloyl-ACP methyl ester carboxylesterase